MEPLFGPTPPIWNTLAAPQYTTGPMPYGARAAGTAAISTPSQIRMAADALAVLPSLGATELIAPTEVLIATVAARRGQPRGPMTDAEIEDFLDDALDLIPGTSEVEVRCEDGRAILTGNVPHKRHKRDVGEIAWAIPSVNDVQNNVAIVARRRARNGPARDNGGQAARTQKHA